MKIISVLIGCLLWLNAVYGSHSDDVTSDATTTELTPISYDDGNFHNSDQTYGVIVDCGSSGTRVHIYHWDNELSYSELLHHVHPLRDKDGKPITTKFTIPLSNLETNPEKASVYFKPIMKFITDNIPNDRHQFTGVYIMATAGMRLLDEPTQQEIMAKTKKYIEDHYEFPLVRTSVISGTDEGMYQWISVNAKSERFLSKKADPNTKTLEIIEMGGASIQVTFRLVMGLKNILLKKLPTSVRKTFLAQIRRPEMSRTNQLDESEIDHNYVLHSTTFLGFGSNSARDATIDLLIKQHLPWFKVNRFWDKFVVSLFKNQAKGATDGNGEQKATMTINDPCLPIGHKEIVLRPARMITTKDQTIGFAIEDNEKTFAVKLVGTSSYDKCRKVVRGMLSLAKKERLNCKPEDEICTMDLLGEEFVPFNYDYLEFNALADFYYTTNTMLDLGGTYNHEEMKRRTRKICNSKKKHLKAQYPDTYGNEKVKDRIWTECFKAVWVDTFLTKGLRMPSNCNIVRTVGKIKGDDPEWTLGAVLDKSLAIEKASEGENRKILSPGYKDRKIKESLGDLGDESPSNLPQHVRFPKSMPILSRATSYAEWLPSSPDFSIPSSPKITN